MITVQSYPLHEYLENKPDYLSHEDVLDHGYVRLVDAYGSDKAIVRAARMSTDKGFLGWGATCSACAGHGHKVLSPGSPPIVHHCALCAGKGHHVGDEKLLAYLYSNHHDTPFEMAGLMVEVQAPIFVFREWHRHRTQSYNELSARYTPLPDVNYVPSVERLMMNASGSNRQANRADGAPELTVEGAAAFQKELRHVYEVAEVVYQHFLGIGVPKELARCGIPVGRYSRMMASANLRNWLAFITLRSAPNAQWEIRQYANIVAGLVAAAFPRTHELFVAGRK